MGQSPEIQILGTTVTTTRVNLRQGAPSTKAPVLRKLEVGTVMSVRALAVGETVSGNAHWFLTDDSAYVWAGACGPLKALAGMPVTLPPAANGVATPIPIVSPTVRVVDMSHGDAVTNLSDARKSGLLAVIHKATTGATGRDDAYHARRKSAEDAGLLWGAYHWGTAAPADQQVENFLGWAQPDDRTLLALDFETTTGNQMTLEMARGFLEGLIQRVGRKAIIYSGPTIKADLAQGRDSFFGSHRLWLAQYGSHPKVQVSWNDYWLWQYTDGESGPVPRFVPGIPGDSKGRLDCDHFAGTEEELAAQWA